jgi:hypothetical protein
MPGPINKERNRWWIDDVRTLSSDQIRKGGILKAELLKILDEEELYWFKRCHETWLLKVDNNTDFFHRMINGRKRKQTIFSLQDGANHITGSENLVKHATAYYKKLFGPREGNVFNLDTSLWSEEDSVTDLEHYDLSKPFTEEEIKVELF